MTYTGCLGPCLQVSITPTAADGNFVNAIWASDTDIYTQLQACPTSIPDYTHSSGTSADAILAAVNRAIYGVPISGVSLTSVTYADGKYTFTRDANDWIYAITSVSVSML